ncbi:histone chaperone ASF1 [Gregarina niphandrodes]|uniref:Histone chaperone ASF1 n=1 Tax=Gregarina niphandrodes TaxID=110365 RepID=A0A023AZ93_GRENI|nr:histone chaperone ASF1 [Gregarina niphandrodes]EZG43949.1 histone chaperone ASF1 [Gregarina niphandrodes]|eukprot:XP_011132880.1 histone chaperone ASF1 [Gregarina niphandrodes]
MSWVVVNNASIVGPNPCTLNTPFRIEVSFQCREDLTLPLVWRLIYVGSPDDKSKDQELECAEIGPLKKGSLRFTLEADPPDFTKIDDDDVHGSTVVLLEASYRGQEFIRIGWYVHNTYVDPVLQEDPPDVPVLEKMVRWVVVDEPRVTRFQIKWESDGPCNGLCNTDVMMAMDSTTVDGMSN